MNPEYVSLANVQDQLSRVVDEAERGDSFVITRSEVPVAVLMGYEEYEALLYKARRAGLSIDKIG